MRFKLFASVALVALFVLTSISFAQQVALLDQVAALKASTDALNKRVDALESAVQVRLDATDAKIDALAAKVAASTPVPCKCTCNCPPVAVAPTVPPPAAIAVTPPAPVQWQQVCDGNSCRVVPMSPASSGAAYADACASGSCGAGRGGFLRRLLGR